VTDLRLIYLPPSLWPLTTKKRKNSHHRCLKHMWAQESV